MSESRTQGLRDAAANAAVALARTAGRLVRGARDLGGRLVGRAVEARAADDGPRIVRPTATAVMPRMERAPVFGPGFVARRRARAAARQAWNWERARQQDNLDRADSVTKARGMTERFEAAKREADREWWRVYRAYSAWAAGRVRTVRHNTVRRHTVGNLRHFVARVGQRTLRTHVVKARQTAANPWLVPKGGGTPGLKVATGSMNQPRGRAMLDKAATPHKAATPDAAATPDEAATPDAAATPDKAAAGLAEVSKVGRQYTWWPPEKEARPAVREWSGRAIVTPRTVRTFEQSTRRGPGMSKGLDGGPRRA